jgi:hypothetical protein
LKSVQVGIYLLSIKKKLDSTSANATITTNRKPEILLYEMAVKLARKIFNLKCKGSTLVMRWRKDKQDIEVITGYTPPSSSNSRIQMLEYEEGEEE